MDPYKIDSHKLIYHVERLSRWRNGKAIYPIYVEIAPSGNCNHRCIFCALDYLDYQSKFINTAVLKKFIYDIGKKDVKSIMFAGEGEPLLHPGIADLIAYAKDKKIDVALTTNGVFLNTRLLKNILGNLTWLRVSIDAANPETYALIHRAKPRDFYTVINNLREAVKIKNRKKYKCTIGAQLLLLTQNYKEAEPCARLAKKIGLDYLIIKPYSQHPLSKNRLGKTINYKKFSDLGKRLEALSDDKCKIVFRERAMDKIDTDRPYKRCLGLPFWTYLSANGGLYACSAFLGDRRFCYGNIYRSSFGRIWNGRKKQAILNMMKNRWDIKNCRDLCRLDDINRYLWELKNPHPHVNFI